VQMPEMSGLEATAAIRRLEEETGTHVPIVGVTAHALKGDRERCLEAGMDAYVPKPIDPQELMRTMASCVRHNVTPSHASTTVVHSDPSNAAAIGATTSDVAQLPMDIAALLQRCRGKASLVEKLLKTFGQQIKGQLDSLRSDLDGRQIQSAGRLAHTIKGMALNLSAGPLCEVAAEMEKRIVAGEIDVAIGCMDALNQRVTELMQYLPTANETVQAKAAATPARES